MSVTIHRCAGCQHKHSDHERAAGSRCSVGCCPCVLSVSDVTSANPAVQVETFPAYDHAAQKWVTS